MQVLCQGSCTCLHVQDVLRFCHHTKIEYIHICYAAGSNLADSLLQTADPSEAIAMAISGAELTVAERERLREEEAHARYQWTQKARAKQIFNEAAAQMEAKGMKFSCHVSAVGASVSKPSSLHNDHLRLLLTLRTVDYRWSRNLGFLSQNFASSIPI